LTFDATVSLPGFYPGASIIVHFVSPPSAIASGALPEPASLPLLGTGVAGMFLRRSRPRDGRSEPLPNEEKD
jgi:hypothetical protein